MKIGKKAKYIWRYFIMWCIPFQNVIKIFLIFWPFTGLCIFIYVAKYSNLPNCTLCFPQCIILMLSPPRTVVSVAVPVGVIRVLVSVVFFSVAASPTLCLKCCWQTTWSFSSFYARSGRVFPDRADVFHKKGKWQVAFHFTQLPKLCRPDSTRNGNGEMWKCRSGETEK